VYLPEFDLSHDLEDLKAQVQQFGFCGARHAISASALERLREEAKEQLNGAKFAEQTEAVGLAYRASITGLGAFAKRFMGSPQVGLTLEHIFDGHFALTAARSCLTHYGSGDHLAAHRDEPAEECDVTIIAYLHVESADYPVEEDYWPRLNIYGRARPAKGEIPSMVIPTFAGTLAIGKGSRYWHERPSLSEGQSVIALTGCFHVLEEHRASGGA